MNVEKSILHNIDSAEIFDIIKKSKVFLSNKLSYKFLINISKLEYDIINNYWSIYLYVNNTL